MSNKKDKSYAEIISEAAKEIKAKASKDLKKVKEELNKPLFESKKDKTKGSEENKEPTLKSKESSKEATSNFKDNKEESKASDDDKSSSPALDRKNSKKEYKKQHPIKYKLKLLLKILLCLLMVLLVSIYVLYIVSHKDNNRDPNTYNNVTSTELIEKNMVDAFKDTKNIGLISFDIPESDINQMLFNASTHILSSDVISMYYESKDEHHYFCFDLTPRLLVNTRVVIDTVIEGYTEDYDVVLGISNVSMGKLPYLNKEKFLNQSFFDNLAKFSNLPIRYNVDAKKIITSPLKLYEYFPSGELFDVVKEMVELKKSILTPSNNSLFGFNIDLSSFRKVGNRYNHSESEVIDLEDRLTSVVNEEYFNGFEVGESKVACSFSLEEYNSLIKSALPELFESKFQSELSSSASYIKIKDVYTSLMVDEIIYTFVVDINGYEVDFDITTLGCDSGVGFTFYSFIDLKASSGGVTFDRYSECYSWFSSYLLDAFTLLDETYEFFNYQDTNLLVYLDFAYIIDQIDASTFRFAFELVLNNITNSSFDFVVTRLI